MSAPPSIIWVVTLTLSTVILVMCGAMVWGLFDPRVDNADIFKIIGPAFSMVIGAFVGFFGGLAVGKSA